MELRTFSVTAPANLFQHIYEWPLIYIDERHGNALERPLKYLMTEPCMREIVYVFVAASYTRTAVWSSSWYRSMMTAKHLYIHERHIFMNDLLYIFKQTYTSA